jgi:DNA-binding response OmpR family regulator
MAGATILVVDDDPLITDLLESALATEGYQVQSAIDEAALRIAHDLQPAVILLDITMPGMDGVEISQRLRADPRTATIPIIVMSAEDRIRATSTRMAVDDRLPKPFGLQQLFALIAKWVPRS